MEAQRTIREPILWWVAGADSRILAECPRGDQIFIQHLAISLIGAFLFVYLITEISLAVAFPDVAASTAGIFLVSGFAVLIAGMVFLIDRLFIQADWDWQASKQKNELARAAWERSTTEEKLAAAAADPVRIGRIGHFARRFLVVSFRVLLSAAIGLTIASFLELVIYKDEIRSLMQRLHYEDNRAVYDEIKTKSAFLDQEIEVARQDRNRLALVKASVEGQINKLELEPPPLPSEKNTASIDAKITELKVKISDEEAKARRQAENMIGERRGTPVNPENSGIVGPGQRFQTAQDLKNLSESAAAQYQSAIESLEAEKKRTIANRSSEVEAARVEIDNNKRTLRAHLSGLQGSLTTSLQRLSALENGRDMALSAFVAVLKAKPNFIPLSVGVASQFRALRTLYREYGSNFEMYMIKLLIMMLEMTPVLQKVFLSPTTLYAVKLDANKRSHAYEYFDKELELRQGHLRRKADAALHEELDGRGLERIRNANVTSLHEGRGAI